MVYCRTARAMHRHKIGADTDNLSARTSIPDEFADDPILGQYICSITLMPIRYPLRDPRTGHLYEAHAIIGWLERNPTSPLTRAPLHSDELERVPEIEQIIVRRLRELHRSSEDF